MMRLRPPTIFAFALGAVLAAVACLAGCSLGHIAPPRVGHGDNLEASMFDEYPDVFVRGDNIVVAAPFYSYRAVSVVLNPSSIGSTSHPSIDPRVEPPYTGYLAVAPSVRKGSSATIPISKFVDGHGHPFPGAAHVSSVGIVFTGGPKSGSGAIMSADDG